MAHLREMIGRYESEEDEYTRELEQMREDIESQSRQRSETEADDEGDETESDVPQDPQPILSVLCELVDEIGTLRNENRRLKTRLSLPRPRSRQSVVERMSALLEQSGSIFPRLTKRIAPTSLSPAARGIGGARERLATPPRKDPLTVSSISTDFSSLDSGGRSLHLPPRPVPIVQPEASDSDFESEESATDNQRRARRDGPPPGCRISTHRGGTDASLSDCTSPSSACSSRDVSEAMTTSRSSFLEFFGVKKRREIATPSALLGVPRYVAKKRRARRASDDEAALRDANGEVVGRKRDAPANKRHSCRFTLGDSEATDGSRPDTLAKHRSVIYGGATTASSAAPSPMPSAKSEEILLNHVLSRHNHEKDNLRAEIEELRIRNQRLIEQMREKSLHMSHVQNHARNLEKQVESLRQRCALSDALDKLTLSERMAVRPNRFMDKVEERLRLFEAEMQTAKAEANSAHQMTMSACGHERTCYRNCLEQIERLQKENFCLIRGRLIDSDDSAVRHRLAMMPSYDALYSFAMRVVRKLGAIRQTLLERCTELSRTEVDLIAAQSSLLVTHAQIERLKLQRSQRRRRRTASWHGLDGGERRAHSHLNFFLPFRLQGTRVENSRQAARLVPKEVIADGIENEFISLFGYAKALSRATAFNERLRPQSPTRPMRHRRDLQSPSPPHAPSQPPPALHPILAAANARARHGSGNGAGHRSSRWPTPQQVIAIGRTKEPPPLPSFSNAPPMQASKRPVSLVEVDGRVFGVRAEGRRRSQKGERPAPAHARVGSGDGEERKLQRRESAKADVRTVASMQDVSGHVRTPNGTPVLTRRLAPPSGRGGWDHVDDLVAVVPQRDERREERRATSRLERSRPVQSRRPPTHLRDPKLDDRRPQLQRPPSRPHAGGACLTSSYEYADNLSSPKDPSSSPKSPPTSPKLSRLPVSQRTLGASAPAAEPPAPPKGLSWLSKLKQYKHSSK